MPRKTAIYGFNLFYHDESVLSAEDIRPGSSYTGTLQPDPTNTLNFNFKLMEDLIQDVLNGTLAFTKVRAVQDVEAGRDVVVGRYLVLNPEYGIVLARDRRPTPHILLDFGDALVHAGYDDTRSVSLSVGGSAQGDAERLRPFAPDTLGRRFQGASTYPVVYTISTSGTLFDTRLSAIARLFLAFDSAPQGLSAVRLEASYDGSTYVLLGHFTQDLARSSLLFDEVTFAQAPKALRVTLEGTNSASTDFTLTRLALLHAGTPALEGFYLPRRGGKLWGDLQVLGNTTLGDSSSDITTVNGNLSVTGNTTLGDASSDTVTAKGDVTVEGKVSVNTIQSRNGNLNLSAGGWGITFDVDTDSSGSDVYTWRIKNAEVMRLTNTGNLGLGTTSPQSKLDVAGDVRSHSAHLLADGTPRTNNGSVTDVRSFLPLAGNAFFGSTVESVQYWDGAAWVAWSGAPDFQQLLDAVWNTITVSKAKFRFSIRAAGGLIAGPLLILKNYSAAHSKAWNLTFERSTDNGATWTSLASYTNTFNSEGTWWFPLSIGVSGNELIRVTFDSPTWNEAADTLWLGNLWLSAGRYPTRHKVSYHGERYLSNQRVFAVENIPATPSSDGGTDLGLSSLRWRDLNLSRNATVGGNATVTGNLTVAGNTTLGDSSSDTVTAKGNLTVEGDLTLSSSGKTLTAPRVASTVIANSTSGGGPVRYLANNQNLLANPDGSLGLEGWTVVSGTVNTGYNQAHGWQFNASGAFEVYADVGVWLTDTLWLTLDALAWGSTGAELQYKVEELDSNRNLLATVADWTTVAATNTNLALSPNPTNPNWVNQNAGGYVRVRLRATATSSSTRHWRLGVWEGLPGVATAPYSGGIRWLYDNAAVLSHNETVTGAWTFNSNIALANGVTVDGVDPSAFKAAYDAHEHNGTDAPKVKAGNVLAKAFDPNSFPNNNNPYTYNVQSYLDALQDQINDLVTGTATFDNLLVKNLNFTVGGTFNANGVTLNAGALSLTGNAQAAQLVSTAAQGTAPLQVASSTKVTNLNADLLDGYDSTDFPRKAEDATITGSWTFSTGPTVNGSLTLNNAPLRISHPTGPLTYDVLRATGSDSARLKLILEAGGPLIVASGAAGTSADGNISVGNETLYLLSDQDVKLITGLQSGWGSRKEAVTITSTGLVGVQTPSPAYELDVNGTVQASVLRSTAITGTAPLVVASSTRVTNLNADLLDGYDATDFARKAENATVTGSWTFNSNVTVSGNLSLTGNVQGVQLVSTAASGTAPLQVASTAKVTNLNADLLDGYDAADFARKAENATVTGAWTFSNVLTVNNTLGAPLLQTKAGTSAGGSTHLQLFGSGSLRWGLGLQGTEAAGNVGSDFSIWRYDNSGNYLAKALNINRANGQFTVYGNLEVAKQGDSSFVLFPAQANDPGYIEHWESNNSSRMRFVNSDDHNTADDCFEWGADNAARNSFTARMRLYNSGRLTLYGEGRLELLDSNTYLSKGNDNSLRISTGTGWVDVGPQNNDWAHFTTDRLAFYFSKDVHVNGKVQVYNSNTWLEANKLVVGGQEAWQNGTVTVEIKKENTTPMASGEDVTNSTDCRYIRTPNKTFQIFFGQPLGNFTGEGLLKVVLKNVPFRPFTNVTNIQITTAHTSGAVSAADAVYQLVGGPTFTDVGGGFYDWTFLVYRQRFTNSDAGTGISLLITGIHV